MSTNFPKGFFTNGLHCGIKKNGKNDLAIFYSYKPCVAAGMFTTNIFRAAPVIISEKKIKNKIYAIIANSGCANACTGKRGIIDAEKMCKLVADEIFVKPENVLVASTGVIGQFLPIAKIESGIKKLVTQNLTEMMPAVEGIMTTDTFPKLVSSKFRIGKSEVCIWGCAKGSGMIEPNMACTERPVLSKVKGSRSATMLSFILTDAAITKNALSEALKKSVNKSFNCLTVDGDTSTNDTVLILANAESKNKTISSGKDFQLFCSKLDEICVKLVKMLAMDGEGATKLITINVQNVKNTFDAKKIAKTVANSPLVKTAIYGNDANWGRIVAAIGRSGVKVNSEKVDVSFGNLYVFKNGRPVNFSEIKAKNIISLKEVEINIKINTGKESATVYTCDFTEEYIKVNASYRS
ncbi:MAG: bifunctional ornithine acetyltransferase/N-acetylglutamate synthase [Elusimicrobia bacterium RIFOXYD2_FULL_34_15]|nr:MAG: bifunctional ornithine acetyltransferase/N-acetylglutamate synthase [Elusimicrobia bacterium RIFOXYD2_FULL_34_15]